MGHSGLQKQEPTFGIHVSSPAISKLGLPTEKLPLEAADTFVAATAVVVVVAAASIAAAVVAVAAAAAFVVVVAATVAAATVAVVHLFFSPKIMDPSSSSPHEYSGLEEKRERDLIPQQLELTSISVLLSGNILSTMADRKVTPF